MNRNESQFTYLERALAFASDVMNRSKSLKSPTCNDRAYSRQEDNYQCSRSIDVPAFAPGLMNHSKADLFPMTEHPR